MRVGRIPYINCYPVYGAIDRGIVKLNGTLVDGTPSELNARIASGDLDVSVVSAVEYARDSSRYLLLPDLAVSCDGPVRSVMLFSHHRAEDLGRRKVLVSRSSMTSAVLLDLLFENVWRCAPRFVRGNAELSEVTRFEQEEHDARLVIGDAALLLGAGASGAPQYPHVYDLGAVWKEWTGLPFVFAVWVALRSTAVKAALRVHASLIESRNWGVTHVNELAVQAAARTSVSEHQCRAYLTGLDYGLSYPHLAGLTNFFGRLVAQGRVPNGTLSFLPAA